MSPPESEDRTGDARPASPGAKALGAMEVAARRARESRAPSTATRDPDAPPGRDEPAAWGGPPDAERWDSEAAPGSRTIATVPPERWLAVAVGAAAVLVVAAAIALVVSLTSGSSPGPVAAPPAGHGTSHANGTAAGSGGGGAAQPSGAPAAPQTTSTLPSLGTPGGAPVISSLTPSSGSSGQTLQVTGSNFLSSDGQIVATFAGQVAPTACPSQTTCTVTVPPTSAAPGPVPVTITTSAGTSNTVTFTYG